MELVAGSNPVVPTVTTLNDHLDRVERYGFNRYQFPLSYKGHMLEILCNDAYMEEGRLLFDFSLFCTRCRKESDISGRFPADFDDQMTGVVAAKLAAFETFKSNECV